MSKPKRQHIIVWKDKHGTLYYAANTEMEKAYAYEQIFTSMLEAGYYCEMSEAEQEVKQWKNRLVKLQALQKSLEEGAVQETLREEAEKKIKEITQIERIITARKYDIRVFNSAKDGNVKSMKEWIRSRANYEYERVYNDVVICPPDEDDE